MIKKGSYFLYFWHPFDSFLIQITTKITREIEENGSRANDFDFFFKKVFSNVSGGGERGVVMLK